VTPDPDPATALDAARAGDRGALARLLTAVERGGSGARSIGRLAFERAGSAYTVGITGAPGAGKSTLTSAVVAAARTAGDRLAVLAIDPSSPFTGGAILGDRVRMGEHALDDGVFIRSMATRGHLGGLALATPEAIRVLDAAGFPWVLVETVGVGQVEVEVAGAADTTVVVVNPGWGDAVQANKAGLMEIADVFVVNKADRDGAAQTRHDIESMLDLTRGHGSAADEGGAWRPPVVLTTGTTGDGAGDLWSAIADHRRHLEASGDLVRRREARLREELALVVEQRLRARAEALLDAADRGSIEAAVAAGRLDPWSAADIVLGEQPDG
jgi:LAO/AO transport system kinase